MRIAKVLKGRGFQPRRHEQKLGPALAAGVSRMEASGGVGKEGGSAFVPGAEAPILRRATTARLEAAPFQSSFMNNAG
jgi:hypothetical protein